MKPPTDAIPEHQPRSGVSSLGGFVTLGAGIAFVLLQLLTISGIAYGVKRMQDDGDRAIRLEAASSEVDRLQRAVMEVLLTDGSSTSRKMVGDTLDRLGRLHDRGVLEGPMASARLDWDAFRQAARHFQQARQMSVSEVDAMVALGRFTRQATQLGEALSGEAAQGWRLAGRTRDATLYVIAAAALLNGLGTAFIYWLFYRRVTRPLRYASTVAAALAQGDFSRRIDTRGGEATALLHALQGVQQRLGAMIGDIRLAAESVLRAANDIAAGHANLASRTETQASTLEETASSMEELTSAVQQNAHSAQSADSLARGASEVAGKAGAVVGDMAARMDGITTASRRISEIIGLIDGIAFQTNILALNAAVEAARAGEQGRGFAVVAAEVRTLAQRSAGAAKEIRTLIDAAAREVEAGTQLARQAGGTMTEVMGSVGRVTELIGSIALASREQNDGIGQVNSAVSQMDTVVQENAVLVQQGAEATDQMREQAHALLESMARFRLAT